MDTEARLLIHPSDQPSPFTSTVTDVNEDWIRLASTEFYPTGGGQPHDTGSMSWNEGRCQVIDVKGRNEVLHQVEGELPVVGTIVDCSIDAPRRIRLAQMHTAQHLASALADEVWGAETVGNQIGIEATRIDLKFEDRDAFDPLDLIERINDEIRSNHAVRMDHRSLDNLRNDPNVRISLDRIPNVSSLRTIEIEDIDVCPCAGTHVGSTGEIPEVAFDASKSKGAGKLRVSYRFA
tara:strand:- start:228 stop:935 length:708 start_codon:yes stop_codon:yes gene_type:complete